MRADDLIAGPIIRSASRLDHVEDLQPHLIAQLQVQPDRRGAIFYDPLAIEIIEKFRIGVNGFPWRQAFQRKDQLP